MKRLIAFVLVATTSHAVVYYVNGTSGNDDNPGISWESAKQTIAGALEQASEGDEVWVAAGTYAGGITLPSGVALYGGFSTDDVVREQRDGTLRPTKLSGGPASVVTIPDDASSDSVVDSFIIQSGNAVTGGGICCGAGSAPRIERNTIQMNLASLDGGAIWCGSNSHPVIRFNTIADNQAAQNGGGLACEEGCAAEIAVNLIRNNVADGFGGGIFCNDCSPSVVSNSDISYNQAERGAGFACRGTDAKPEMSDNSVLFNNASLIGGGGYLCEGAEPTIVSNRFAGNRAPSGGGLAAIQSSARIERCIWNGNQALSGNGGAIALLEGSAPQLIGNLMSGNSASGNGGAIHLSTNATAAIINNTVADNTAAAGGGLGLDGASPGITNNIVAFNSSGIAKQSDDVPNLTCNDVALNTESDYSGFSAPPTGTDGNLSTNPLFVARETGNYHLSTNSPCRDAGTNAAVDVSWLDTDGEFRIQPPDGGTVDIGFDEFHTGRIARPTFNPDGGTYDAPVTVTISPATPGSTVRYTVNGGDPDETSPVIADGGELIFEAETTLRARAYFAGWEPSHVKTSLYAFTRVAMPFFTPPQGRYESPLAVTVTCATAGATIHWTTNSLTPTTNDPVVVSGGSVTLDAPRLLKARAWMAPLEPSDVRSAGYALDVLFVKKPGGSVQNGLDWATAFGSIQAALDVAATSGYRRIWVAAYKPGGGKPAPYFEHLVMPDAGELMGGFLGGEYAPEQRVPDWTTNAEVIIHGSWVMGQPTIQEHDAGSPGPTRIDSVTVRGGCGSLGGGIMFTYRSKNLEIAHCSISENGYFYDEEYNTQYYTEKGGGVYIGFLGNNESWIHDCQIEGNFGDTGGGIYANGSALIEDCSLSGNHAWTYGGGVAISGAPFVQKDTDNDGDKETAYDTHACVRNNLISQNRCNWPDMPYGEGGGLMVSTGNNGALIFDNLIQANEARLRGGGIACIDANALFAGNRIEENFLKDAPEYGAGVYVYFSTADYSSGFVNNYVYKNCAGFPACGGGFAVLGYGWYSGVASPNLFLINNRIVKNAIGISGGGLFFQARFWYLFCSYNTVADNVAPDGTSGYFLDFLPWPISPPEPTGKLDMIGDIVIPNVVFEHLPWTNSIYCNDVGFWSGITNQTGTNGNISVDPGLRAVDNSYRITPGSPVEDRVPAFYKIGETVTPGGGSSSGSSGTTDICIATSRYPVRFDGMREYDPRALGWDMDYQGQGGLRYDMGADEINYCKRPIFYPPAGSSVPTNITIVCDTPGATIRYTTDGQEPTLSSPEVPAGGVTLSSPGTLSARAFWTTDLSLWPSTITIQGYGITGTLMMLR